MSCQCKSEGVCILKESKFLLLQEPRKLRSRRQNDAQTAPNQHPYRYPPPHSTATLDHMKELEIESLRWDGVREGLSGSFLEKFDCISIYCILYILASLLSSIDKWFQGQQWL